MSRSLVSIVQELAQLDATIARAAADKKKLDAELIAQKELLTKIHRDATAKIKLFEERRTAHQKEERSLKEEREKISERRKGLGSHNNYKVQQAAEKELDYLARQVNLKEEALIKGLSDIEALEKDATAWREKFDVAKANYEKVQKEIAETFPVLDERTQRATTARQELIHPIDKARLTLYERARSRFPTDPVVLVNEQQSCTGCFMNVGPQVVQQVLKGDTLVKCPGCNRVLFISDTALEASQAQ